MRSVLLLGIALTAGALACGGFDDGNPLRTRPVTVGSTDPTEPEDDDDGVDDADAGAEDTDDAADGSTLGPTPDGGSDAATPPKLGVFDGAPAYVATAGPGTRKAAHDFAGNTPTTNPAGRPCLSCHGAAGPAPRFAIAGTIYRDAPGTEPAARVEVRIIDANSRTLSTYTDADGNFFARPPAGGGIAFPVKVGARDGDTIRSMTAASAGGNCNNCHRNGGASTPLAVP